MAMTLITTNTSSGASGSAFTSSIDGTYKLYIFKWYDLHPSANNASLEFNGSIDGGSNYNVTKTTTYFNSAHNENDNNTNLAYDAARDVAQGTGYQKLFYKVDGAASDNACVGELFLFNPSNTTYVTHFYSTIQTMSYDVSSTYSMNSFVSGYFNTTDNIDALNFQMDSGNMDAGTIKMYGVG